MTIQVPDHTQRGLVVLSPTRVNQGIRCLRKHTLADTLSYVPSGLGDAAALEFGTRIHAAGALMWQSWADTPDEDHAVVGSEYLRSLSWPLNEKHTLALALQLWGAYAGRAKPMPYDDDDKWEFAAIEQRVVMDVRAGVRLSFQLDRLMRRRSDGALALFDIKTASRCDARWAKQWPRDLQMKLYSEAVRRHYGRELSWLVIEGLSKDNGTLNYVILPEFSEGVRAEAWRDFEWVAQHNEQLLAAATVTFAGREPYVDTEHLAHLALTETPHSPAECFTYGSQCAFLPLCDAEPSERLALLKDGYEFHEPEYI